MRPHFLDAALNRKRHTATPPRSVMKWRRLIATAHLVRQISR
jgi:hypothetical protein